MMTTPDGPKNGAATATRFAPGPRWRFVEAFLREPLSVGSLWPSSTELSWAIVDGCDFQPGATVVELGAGTGAFTGLLLDRVGDDGRLLALELSPTNVAELRRRYPHCQVIHDNAENLTRHLERHQADCVVSGLAWGNMRPSTQDRILDAVLDSLAPGGQFLTFAYTHAIWLPTSRRFRRKLMQHFSRVEKTPIIWRNLPPAFVYRCWRD